MTVKPALRGWSHALAVLPALAGSVILVVAAHGHGALELSLVVYGISLVLLFGVSATYHVPPWTPKWKARWRRIDHAVIFVMIAGTYTPVIGNLLDGWPRDVTLAAIWVLAVAGVVLSVSPLQLPPGVLAVTYVAVGWVAVAVMPALFVRLGIHGLLLLLLGGALYSIGAVVYALERPKLWPRVFGYHELFHLMVIAASAAFFAFIATQVVAAHRI